MTSSFKLDVEKAAAYEAALRADCRLKFRNAAAGMIICLSIINVLVSRGRTCNPLSGVAAGILVAPTLYFLIRALVTAFQWTGLSRSLARSYPQKQNF